MCLSWPERSVEYMVAWRLTCLRSLEETKATGTNHFLFLNCVMRAVKDKYNNCLERKGHRSFHVKLTSSCIDAMSVWYHSTLIMEFAFPHLLLGDPFMQSPISHLNHKYSVFTDNWQKKNIKRMSEECKNSDPIIFRSWMSMSYM